MNYLSIDMDYFLTTESFKRIFAKIAEKEVKFVRDHNELLPDINNCPGNLYNLDLHTDMASFGNSLKAEKEEYKSEFAKWAHDKRELFLLKVSTWVNVVKWRKQGSYTWIMPDEKNEKQGYCWIEDIDNPYLNFVSWKTINKTEDLDIVPWDKIDKVGICVSPEWISWEKIDFDFLKFVFPEGEKFIQSFYSKI